MLRYFFISDETEYQDYNCKCDSNSGHYCYYHYLVKFPQGYLHVKISSREIFPSDEEVASLLTNGKIVIYHYDTDSYELYDPFTGDSKTIDEEEADKYQMLLLLKSDWEATPISLKQWENIVNTINNNNKRYCEHD